MKLKSFMMIVLAIIFLTACNDEQPCEPCNKPDTTIYPNYNYGNIMDTLKGQWKWIKTYGGKGSFSEPNYKSVINILGQDEDSTIFYEVYVEDKLIIKDRFKITKEGQYGERIMYNIKLSHNYDRHFSFDFRWLFWGFINSELQPTKNGIAFSDGYDDGYFYYYEKIK